jgi:hypothetical protein
LHNDKWFTSEANVRLVVWRIFIILPYSLVTTTQHHINNIMDNVA